MGTSFQYAVEVAQAFVCLHESILNKVFFTAQKCSLSAITQGPQLHTQAYKYQVGQQDKDIFSEVEAQSLSTGFGVNVGKTTSKELRWFLGKPSYKVHIK